MAVPKSSGELISLGGVKWHEPLADYYSKHAQALDRNLADSINERNRALEIKRKESLLNQIKQGGDALTAVAKAASTWKTISDQQQAEEKKKLWESLENEPWWIENREDLRKYRSLTYFEKKRELSTNETARLKELKAKFELDKVPEAMHAILNASGTRLANQNELLARHAIAGLSEASMQVDPDWEDFEAWNKAEKNPDKRLALFKKYQLSKIEGLNLNDDAIAAVLGKELIRQSQTVRGTGKAASAVAVSTAEQRRVFSQLITAQRTGSVEETIWSIREELLKSPNFAATEFQTTPQLVDEYLYETLTKLSYDGFINESELQPYIDSGFRHPAGKGPESETTPGEIFFGADKVNRLVSAARGGSGRKLAVQMSIAKNQLIALKEAKLRGENVDEQINLIEGMFKNELKEEIKNVRETNPGEQTQAFYNIEKQDWNARLTSGNLLEHEELAKTIKNTTLNKEVKARIRHHKERRAALGYPKDDEQFVRDRIAKAFNLTLKEDEKLTGKLYELQVHLVQKLRKSFQNQIEGPNGEPIIDPNSFTLANDAFETYIVNNGINGGRVDGAPEGIFTADSQGRLNNFKKFQDQRLDAIREHKGSAELATSQRLRDIYDRQVWNAYDGVKRQPDNGQPLKERVLDSPESVLTKEDLLGFFSTKKLSPEIIYKARRLGIPPSTLIRRQLEALVKANPDYAKLHQLDAIKFPEGGDEQIYGMLERSDSNLRFAFTRADLSPNQNQRMIELWNRALDKKEYDQHLQ